jgi:hypothetical protein
MSERSELVDDSPGPRPELAGFREHRHDQAILSLEVHAAGLADAGHPDPATPPVGPVIQARRWRDGRNQLVGGLPPWWEGLRRPWMDRFRRPAWQRP